METQTDPGGQAANTHPDAAAIARLAEQQRQTADAVRSAKDAQAVEQQQQQRSAELDRLQRDKATLAAEVSAATAREQMLREQLANTTRERDVFKTELDKAAPRLKLADELQTKVAGLEAAAHESNLLDELQPKAPGASRLILKGTLAALHDAGKVNRFATDPKAEAEKALKVFEAEAPQLLRPLTAGGGSPGATSTTNPSKTGKTQKTGLL